MSLAQVLGLTGPTRIPRRFQPFYQQAGSEALVRYAPEWDNLSQVRAASAQTMRQRVAQARSAGAILSNSATLAAKELGQGPNASAPAIQSVIQMLGQRAADAPITANQQAQQYTNEHLADLDKIHAQRASLLRQAGTFTIGRATDLVGSDRKLRHDANQADKRFKQQLLTSGVTETGAVRPGGPKDPHATQLPKAPKTPSTIAKVPSNFPGSEAEWNRHSRGYRDQWLRQHSTGRSGAGPGGVKPATPLQHGELKDRVGSAVTQIDRLDRAIVRAAQKRGVAVPAPAARRHQIAQTLLRGREAQTIDDGQGNKLKVPGVPKFGELSASVALDIFFDKHISRHGGPTKPRGNLGELHSRGYSVRQLGFPTRPRSTNAGIVNVQLPG